MPQASQTSQSRADSPPAPHIFQIPPPKPQLATFDAAAPSGIPLTKPGSPVFFPLSSQHSASRTSCCSPETVPGMTPLVGSTLGSAAAAPAPRAGQLCHAVGERPVGLSPRQRRRLAPAGTPVGLAAGRCLRNAVQRQYMALGLLRRNGSVEVVHDDAKGCRLFQAEASGNTKLWRRLCSGCTAQERAGGRRPHARRS